MFSFCTGPRARGRRDRTMSDHEETSHARKSSTESHIIGDPFLELDGESGQRELPDDLGDRDEILILEQDIDLSSIVDSSPGSSGSGVTPSDPLETSTEATSGSSKAPRDQKNSTATASLVFLENDDFVDAELTEGDVQPMVVEELKKPGRRSAMVVAAACVSILIVAGAVYFFHFSDKSNTPPRRVAASPSPATPRPDLPAITTKPHDAVSTHVAAIPARPRPTPPTVPAESSPAQSATTPPPNTDSTIPEKPSPDASGPEASALLPAEHVPAARPAQTATPETRSVPESPPRTRPTPVPSPLESPEKTETPATTTSVSSSPTNNRSQQALRELVHLSLNEGFSRLKRNEKPGQRGITVLLRGGKQVALNPGESLVELKNGNHFKGHIAVVQNDHIVLSFSYGTIQIPRRDLNHVVPSDSRNDLPLDEYRSGIVRLKNGNRLTGKILKTTDDRVVLGFPSAQIVIPRTAMAQGADALEFTEAEGRQKLLGAGRDFSPAAPGQEPNATAQVGKVGAFLGAPYYDFVNGFSLIPPRGWNKFTKDAIIGFSSPEDDKVAGLLTLGGLFMEASSLQGRGCNPFRKHSRARSPVSPLSTVLSRRKERPSPGNTRSTPACALRKNNLP